MFFKSAVLWQNKVSVHSFLHGCMMMVIGNGKVDFNYLWPWSSTKCSVRSDAKPRPPSGIYHNLTVQSSDALAIMLSLKGFHLISKTGLLWPETCKRKDLNYWYFVCLQWNTLQIIKILFLFFAIYFYVSLGSRKI